QQRWVNDTSPVKMWLAARQIGKSFAVAMEAVVESLETKCNTLILSASERQSNEVMQKVLAHTRVLATINKKPIVTRETKEEVVFSNSSRIISLPANPDTARGFTGNVFLDEFAFHRDDEAIWAAMYPAVTRGYKIRVTSTPNGNKNLFALMWH
ncbi:MAG TPA: terminase family protein, partial [Bacteroidales bacterium]|nr:terminase family protein [Bacteroidales bacterium]